MIQRIYTYRFAYPDDGDKFTATMAQAAEMLQRYNKWVHGVDMIKDGDDVLLKLTMAGHDQWWIKKRIIHPLGALLTRCGIRLKDARLISVERPEDNRSTRPRASDGRSKPLAPEVMIDHSDMMA